MLFDTGDKFYKTESYKERNLYYKIFAGYLLNEFIPDFESYLQRKSKFFDLLINTLQDQTRFRGDKEIIRNILIAARVQEMHTTFDYHSSQIIAEHKQNNRGEMSDVLLVTENYFISVECKYLSDVSYNKDILEVQERIKIVATYLSLMPLQVVLIKGGKWNEAKKLQNYPGSFYTAFQNAEVFTPCIVIFWEDLIPIIDNNAVKQYLQKQLERKYK